MSEYLLISVVVSTMLGFLLAMRAKPLSISSRVALALIPAAAVLVGWDWFISLITAPPLAVPYSACRLTPALALSRGYSPYQPFDRGPIIGCFYPPLSVLAFLPATLLRDPTAAVLTGRIQSLLYCFVPLIWVLTLEVRRGRLRTVNGVILFILFALLANRIAALRYATTEIHADAPALALGCLALGLVGRIRVAEINWAWYGAIVASILAAWTKQVQVLLLLVPIIWAFTFGVRTGLKVLAITFIMAVVISGLLLVAFDFKNCKFYIFDVIRLQRLKGATISENLKLLGFAMGVQMQRPLLVFLGSSVALLVVDRTQRTDPPVTPREFPSWLPFLIGGIVEIPLSTMGYIKVGGDFNQLSFSLFPILFALILIMGRLVDSRPGREFFLMTLVLYLGISEYRQISQQFRRSDRDQSGAVLTWIDEQRLITRYLRTHPDQAYFPFNTFEHLAIDHRLYHFTDGVLVLTSVGFRPSDKNMKDHIPPKMEVFCYPPSFKKHDSLLAALEKYRMGFFPEFRTPFTIPELPGFICFTRAPRVPEAKVSRAEPVK
jgi:hypothetical protein